MADPCMGWLEGVSWACCGHGRNDTRYVSTITGRRFSEFAAYQEHRRWLGTAEAQMAVLCEKWAETFGWELARRSRCQVCQLPGYECTCKKPRRLAW